MESKKLIADIRGELSPIKNFIEMVTKYQQFNQDDGGNFSAFLKGYNKSNMEQLIDKEKTVAAQSLSKIEYMISLLENNQSNGK